MEGNPQRGNSARSNRRRRESFGNRKIRKRLHREISREIIWQGAILIVRNIGWLNGIRVYTIDAARHIHVDLTVGTSRNISIRKGNARRACNSSECSG